MQTHSQSQLQPVTAILSQDVSPADFARHAANQNAPRPQAEETSSFMRSLFNAATGSEIEEATTPAHIRFAAGLRFSRANCGRKSAIAPSELKTLFGAANSMGAGWPKKWLANGEAWLNLQGIYG